MTERELEDTIDRLTDEACSFAAMHVARALTAEYGAHVVADLIDRSCVYVRFVESVALAEGSRCPLQDWHDFAKTLRAAKLDVGG